MIEIAGAPTDLAQPRATVAEAPSANRAELERTCLALLRAEWSALALVTTEAGPTGLALAGALVEMARTYRLRPVRALNASAAITSPEITHLLDEAEAARADGARAVITLGDPIANPGRTPLLLAADAAVVLVRVGSSEFRSVQDVVRLVGAERVIGCIVVP